MSLTLFKVFSCIPYCLLKVLVENIQEVGKTLEEYLNLKLIYKKGNRSEWSVLERCKSYKIHFVGDVTLKICFLFLNYNFLSAIKKQKIAIVELTVRFQLITTKLLKINKKKTKIKGWNVERLVECDKIMFCSVGKNMRKSGQEKFLCVWY